jgi:hypothetical protein
MIIYFKKYPKFNINNLDDLDEFIRVNNIFKYYKKIPNEFVNQLLVSIEETDGINTKEFKSWFRRIVKYPMSVYNPYFLYCMGWENDEISVFISQKQKNNSNKLSELKNKFPEKYYESTITRTEYWLKKGFTESEAIEIISKRQSTFSKEKCIEKYGYEKGIEVFKNRQLKWVESLKSNPNINEIRKRQNSYSDDKAILELIDRTSFLETTKSIIMRGLVSNDIDQFVDFVINEIDIKSSMDFYPYVNSRLIQKNYEVNSTEIKNKFYEKVGNELNIGYYGNMIYDDGIRYKSIKEYKLSQLFKSLNVGFIYEKKYPNSKFVSDFYLPEFETYIEYYGMLDGKNFELLDKNQIRYYNKMIEKETECQKNKIKLISDTNFNNLNNKILNLIKNGNNN